jgi:DNA-binding LacI/PurR family transcriptional regulator
MPSRVANSNIRIRKPSAFDVARVAGVSQTTVSFVLNDRDGQSISEGTRRRVLDAVKELGYRPNRLARGLAHGKTDTVGLLLPFLNSEFHEMVVMGLQEALQENGYRLLFAYTALQADTDDSMVDFLLQHRVDAMVCFSSGTVLGSMPRWLQVLEDEAIPAVIIDDKRFGSRFDCVVSDDRHGMKLAVQHLYDFGHRRVALFSAEWESSPVVDRCQGFENAMRELGMEVAEGIVVTNNISKDAASEIIERAMVSADGPTAFVSISDYVYEHFIMARRECIPDRISLIGYADSYLSRLAGLTSVSQHPKLMGRAAGERLARRIEQPGLAPVIEHTQTSLTIRNSTAAPCR